MDPFGTGQTLPPLQLPPQAPATPATVNPLKKPPKWIRRPVGASFAVSLVSYTNYIQDLASLFHHLRHSSGSCSLLVWRQAGFFGEQQAEPTAASAALLTRRTCQPGRHRNSIFEAL